MPAGSTRILSNFNRTRRVNRDLAVLSPAPSSEQGFRRAVTEMTGIWPNSYRAHRVRVDFVMRPPSPPSEMDFVEYSPSPSSEQDFAVQSPSSPSKQGFRHTVTELNEQTGISPCCHRAYRVDRDFAAHWPSASSRSSPSNAQQAGKNHRVRFFFADGCAAVA